MRARREAGDDLVGLAPLDVEAHEARGERPRGRCAQAHAADVRQPGLEARGECSDPRLDSLAPDRLVEAKRVGERPAVLEGVEPTGREPGAVGRAARRRPCEPGAVADAVVEGRDRRARQLAHPLASPRGRPCRAARRATCGSRTRTRRSAAPAPSPPRRRSRARRRRTAARARAAPPRSLAQAASPPCSSAPTSGQRAASSRSPRGAASSRPRRRMPGASRRRASPSALAHRRAAATRAWRRSRARSSGSRPAGAKASRV